MTEQIVDLRSTLAALRRRRLTVLVVLALGLACAVAYTVWQPPAFVARSGVLLPPSPLDENGKALRDMDTEVQIASSAEVLSSAGKAVDPAVSAVALRRKVEVRAVSTAVLQVQVSDRSARNAAALADAIASEYVAHSFRATSDESDTTIRLLQDQAAKLDEQVRKLDEDIAWNTGRLAEVPPNSGEALRITALIDAIRSQQVDAARQLASVNGRIADARLAGELSRRGTRVLDSAVRPSNAARSRLLRNLGVGAFAGAIAGSVLALVREQRDRRLRRRDEVAEAAGAPVWLSLSVPGGSSATRYRKVLEEWVPAPVESLAMRELFARLGLAANEPPANLVVVTLPGDHAGSMLGLALARFAAVTGSSTALIIATAEPALAPLRRACSSLEDRRPSRENLQISVGPADADVGDLGAAEILVTVLTHEDRLRIPTWGRRMTVMLAVSSGFATADTLASVALACLEAGHALAGVLLANPDLADRTTGQLVVPLASVNDQGDGWPHAAAVLPRAVAAEEAGHERENSGSGNTVEHDTGGEVPPSADELVQPSPPAKRSQRA